jgi:hypothetical protein
MKTNFKNIGLVFAATIALLSCSKDDSIFEEGSQENHLHTMSMRTGEYDCGATLCPGHDTEDKKCPPRDNLSNSFKGSITYCDFKGCKGHSSGGTCNKTSEGIQDDYSSK